MSIHRIDHEAYSLFMIADKLGGLLEPSYEEPERSIVVAETMHAISSHLSKGAPFTIEGGIVRRRRAGHGPRPLARAVRSGAHEHPLAVGLRDPRRSAWAPATKAVASKSRCRTPPGSSR
jgi:hypothetical protein